MATFQYRAKDSAGNEVSGTIEAGDRAGAIQAVRAQGLMPTALGEIKGGGSAASSSQPSKGKKAAPAAKPKAKSKDINIKLPEWMRGKIKTKTLTQFTRMLATLVTSGLPLMRGLEVLKRQMKDPQMMDAINGIIENIGSGGTFSEALTAYPKIFDNLYVNMVKAGEAGGVLEVVLGRLAEFAEKSEKIANKVKSAMTYPTIVLFAAVGITGFLLVAVIPKFQQVFQDMMNGKPLPAITQMVMNWSEYIQHNGIVIVLVVAAIVVACKIINKTEKGAYMFDLIKIKAPIMGTLTQRSGVARLTRTLGTLLSSGVPILQSLVIVRDTTGNRVLKNAIQSIHDSVKEGESMTQPLARPRLIVGL